MVGVIALIADRKKDRRPVAAGPGRFLTSHRLRVIAVVGLVAFVLLGAVGVISALGPHPGDLRPGTEVPQQFRDAITDAAHDCKRPGVTPALIAAMLYAESGFDAGKQSPDGSEVGIAMWTPLVFAHWAPTRSDRAADPWDPYDAIAAMGPFLCELAQSVGFLRPHDPRLLIAAGYRVGGESVRQAKGIPSSAAAYTEIVRKKLIEYGY